VAGEHPERRIARAHRARTERGLPPAAPRGLDPDRPLSHERARRPLQRRAPPAAPRADPVIRMPSDGRLRAASGSASCARRAPPARWCTRPGREERSWRTLGERLARRGDGAARRPRHGQVRPWRHTRGRARDVGDHPLSLERPDGARRGRGDGDLQPDPPRPWLGADHPQGAGADARRRPDRFRSRGVRARAGLRRPVPGAEPGGALAGAAAAGRRHPRRRPDRAASAPGAARRPEPRRRRDGARGIAGPRPRDPRRPPGGRAVAPRAACQRRM